MIIHREYRAVSAAGTGLIVIATILTCASTGPAQTGAAAPDYTGLCQAAARAVELGEFQPDRRQRDSLFAEAESYARRAVTADPNDARGHFELARALGRKALSLGVRERASYAVEVRAEALAALAIDPDNAGALHVLGVWNHQIMQLSAVQRLFAKTILGARVFGRASWDEAARSLEDAVAREPNRIVHRLDLARVYAARKRTAQARDQLQWILVAPVTDYNDGDYKREAAAEIKNLR